MTRQPDEITLAIPGGREFQRVAHLVLGGVAAQHDLTIQSLEDLQIGLGAILDRTDAATEVTLVMTVHTKELALRVGPVNLEGEPADDENVLSLRRVLATVADEVAFEDGFVHLTKATAKA